MADPTLTLESDKPWGTLLFPQRYLWFIVFSALDVLLTFVILQLGGREANPVADWVLQTLGIAGMTVFKFALVSLVIVLIEIVGRRDMPAGRRMTLYAIALTMTPVVISVILISGALRG